MKARDRDKLAYRRLPGCQRGFYLRSTLWLGDDHLLLVNSHYYNETYRRLPFREIQAVTLRRTAAWRNLGLFIAAGLGLFSVLTLRSLSHGHSELAWLWGILAAVFLLGLVIHLTAGPSCECQMRLPLGTVRIPSLRRRKTAHRVLSRIRPLIETAQGPLDRQDVSTFPPRQAPPAARSARPSAPPAAVAETDRLFPPSPWFAALFAALALDGFLGIAQIRFDSSPFSFVRIILFTLLVFFALSALTRGQSRGSKALKGTTWGVLLYLIGSALGSYVLMIFVLFSGGKPKPFISQVEIYQRMQRVRPSASALLRDGLWTDVLVSLLLAAIGLTIFLAARRRAAAAERRPAHEP